MTQLNSFCISDKNLLIAQPVTWMLMCSALVQVIVWCHQAASHSLSQCCHNSLSSYGITRWQCDWSNIKMYIFKPASTRVIQINICAEYLDMLPRPRLVCQEPGLRPIGRSPGVPDKSSRSLGSMSRYSAQILICFIAYIFLSFPFLCGFDWELCRTASMHSALCHCQL